jgi:hypothetical protein
MGGVRWVRAYDEGDRRMAHAPLLALFALFASLRRGLLRFRRRGRARPAMRARRAK